MTPKGFFRLFSNITEILVCYFDLSHPISEQVVEYRHILIHSHTTESTHTTTGEIQRGYVTKKDTALFQALHITYCFLKIKNINNFVFWCEDA